MKKVLNTFDLSVTDIDEVLHKIDDVCELIKVNRNADVWSGTITIRTLLNETDIRGTIHEYLIE